MFARSKTVKDMEDRLKKVELEHATSTERDFNILTAIKDMKTSFQSHDEKEMVKYDAINKSISKLYKIVWIAVGVVVTLETLHKLGLLNI